MFLRLILVARHQQVLPGDERTDLVPRQLPFGVLGLFHLDLHNGAVVVLIIRLIIVLAPGQGTHLRY